MTQVLRESLCCFNLELNRLNCSVLGIWVYLNCFEALCYKYLCKLSFNTLWVIKVTDILKTKKRKSIIVYAKQLRNDL